MTAIIPLSPFGMPSSPVLPRLYRAADPAPVCRLPLLLQRIPAGFPSPADEYAEAALDLNTYLIRNKVSTFFFRVMGDSMTGANIHDGDLLVVDRSIEPKHGHIVLAVINNEYTVKRLYHLDGAVELHAENPVYPPIRFQEHDELQVWGVVIGAVSRFPV
ncbi:LexA family protein [Nitrosospira multiformis]|uniref:SOS response UmuD protein. Serine peptidase. MEROPS family S24 n=1 Tax=Nitrosospira multiformis TaxID=1231 RepID=A0A1I7I3K8_9PROT|nr:translesion error-prone DNA polymerase V autoproteolytic subunit [Nitrosospira multiformis]SFU67519.1 SOS response UmuD protein. Serine peptidase. MEROPS family S24 [Nitrosospira multiformis]